MYACAGTVTEVSVYFLQVCVLFQWTMTTASLPIQAAARLVTRDVSGREVEGKVRGIEGRRE